VDDPRQNGCPEVKAVQGDRFVPPAPILFESSRAAIRDESLPAVRALAELLVQASWIKKIHIEGHTDSQGDDQANLELSERRARALMELLVQYGVDPARMEARGYGETRPVADNTSARGRAENRRVEFVIIDPPSAVPHDGDGSSRPSPADEKPPLEQP
jgi:outer membrane protein OmpA-like peptidoglycan-associated protein